MLMVTRFLVTTMVLLSAVPRVVAEEDWFVGEGAPVVELSGRMGEDFRTHALDAGVCATDRMPTPNVLRSWKKLGVRMLRLAAWSPEESPEFFRRKAGLLAFHEGADGVWLKGESSFSDDWRSARAAAADDVRVARRLSALAARAEQSPDHRVRAEGRRVRWMFAHLDFEGGDLDALRLEFVAYAKFLEALLKLPAEDLPTASAAALDDRPAKFSPVAPGAAKVRIDFGNFGADARLGDGLDFHADDRGFRLVLSGDGTDFPGGRPRVRLYLPGVKTRYDSCYEYQLDLTPVLTPRASAPAAGEVYWIRERFGEGTHYIYGDRGNWRCRTVQRRSWGPEHRRLEPRFRFAAEKGRWSASLDFSWLPLAGRWPMSVARRSAEWYLSVEGLPGSGRDIHTTLVWPSGAEERFRAFASYLQAPEVLGTYQTALDEAKDLYGRWRTESLYGFLCAKEPTWQLFDGASGALFEERCLAPLVARDAELAGFFAIEGRSPKIASQDAATQMRVWRALERLLDFGHDVSVARRDYLAGRFAGKIPPPPAPPRPSADAALGPSLDADAGEGLELDDKEF